MPVKLSKTSKMNAKSWSLQAGETCAGSYNSDGSLVDACSGCYAQTGAYNWPATIASRAFNKEDWKRPDWEDDMVHALRKETHFRWFDSGDLYSTTLAEKIYSIMQRTPHVKHWLPTRMAKFSKYAGILDMMQSLPNVMVRFSSDSVIGEFTPGLHGSTIFPMGTEAPQGTVTCEAYTRDGKCGDCYACYSKDVPVIAYPTHGHKMKRVIMLKQAA
jgi:hypothetical protein